MDTKEQERKDFLSADEEWKQQRERIDKGKPAMEFAENFIHGITQSVLFDTVTDMSLAQIRKFSKQITSKLTRVATKKGSAAAVNYALRFVVGRTAGKKIATAMIARLLVQATTRAGIMVSRAIAGACSVIGVGLTVTAIGGLIYDLVDKHGYNSMPTTRRELRKILQNEYAPTSRTYLNYANDEITPELLLLSGADEVDSGEMWFLSTKENAHAYVEYMAEYLGALKYNSNGEPINRDVSSLTDERWWTNILSEQPVVAAPDNEDDLALFPWLECSQAQEELAAEIESGILRLKSKRSAAGGAEVDGRRVEHIKRFDHAPTVKTDTGLPLLTRDVHPGAEIPLVAGLGAFMAFELATTAFGFGCNRTISSSSSSTEPPKRKKARYDHLYDYGYDYD